MPNETEFEVWVKRRYKDRFLSATDPVDVDACDSLLRAQARRYKAKVGDVELRYRHRGRRQKFRSGG